MEPRGESVASSAEGTTANADQTHRKLCHKRMTSIESSGILVPPLQSESDDMTTRKSGKTCGYQDCNETIQPWFELCGPHNTAKQSGEIDQCPNCGQYKDAKFPLCRSCNANNKTQPAPSARTSRYEPESNPKWDAADQEGDVFFIYILKLDGGKFYAGHTRELRERIGEHRDGKSSSTAGKNPRLVWFEVVDTREEAAEGEAHLKELIDRNEREVRRMVNEFQDLISLVELESNRSDSTPQSGSDGNKNSYRPRWLGHRRQAAR